MTGVTTIRVRYAETDRMGLLHHANYLVYFEQARTEYEASKLIGEFRPACAIVETECVSDAARLVRCLLEDARVPGLQVLVTADTGEMPPAVIVIGRPLTAEAVARALQRVPVEAYVGC